MEEGKMISALEWINSILDLHQTPYQIVGGLAARIHGGSRAVADIDLYIPREFVESIMADVSEYLSKPLEHRVEAGWDLEYLQIIYLGQKIEIGLISDSGDINTKIFDQKTKCWVELLIDLERSEWKEFAGLRLPVMPVSDLISYKTILSRDVDLIDIRELI